MKRYTLVDEENNPIVESDSKTIILDTLATLPNDGTGYALKDRVTGRILTIELGEPDRDRRRLMLVRE